MKPTDACWLASLALASCVGSTKATVDADAHDVIDGDAVSAVVETSTCTMTCSTFVTANATNLPCGSCYRAPDADTGDVVSAPTEAAVCTGACILGYFNGTCGCCCEHSDADAAVCTVGQDQTCNEDPALNAFEGTCRATGCVCNTGFELNAVTGKCQVPPSTDAATDDAGD
jgi:hypothetical protein